MEIHSEDRVYLRILWQLYPQMSIEEYQKKTVTYGTSCASCQALRTLQHLASTEKDRFPIAMNVIMRDTFMDDILTGACSEEETSTCTGDRTLCGGQICTSEMG